MSERKKPTNPYTRAKAKRWFARVHHGKYRIVGNDGAKETAFRIVPMRPGLGRIICARYGVFTFRESL